MVIHKLFDIQTGQELQAFKNAQSGGINTIEWYSGRLIREYQGSQESPINSLGAGERTVNYLH